MRVARLTVLAVQLLIYLAYGMLRAGIDSPERKPRFSAVYGIVAFVTVPISWFTIRWWRTLHPDVLTGGEGTGITPPMLHTLLVCLAAFTLLYTTLLLQRMRLEWATDALVELRLRMEDYGSASDDRESASTQKAYSRSVSSRS